MLLKSLFKQIRKNYIAYIFILPCVAILLVMMVTPTIQTIQYSFSKITLPSFDTKFIGFDNFMRILKKPEFLAIIKNTIVWVLASVIFKFMLGFGSALLMNSAVKGISRFQIFIMLPWTIPSIVASNLWRWIFQSDNGLINSTLQSVGLGNLAHTWLGDPLTAMPAVIVASTWAGFPFIMLMLLSGLKTIPKDYYEAGKIDGTTNLQAFYHITLPCLKDVIFVVLILEIVGNLNAFDMLFNMTGGGPGGSSEIIGLFIYRLAFTNIDFAGASAASVLMIAITVIGFLLYVPATAKGRKGVKN